jgi:hypothetical protein
MSFSRRKFLRAGTVAALAAGVPFKSTLIAMAQGSGENREFLISEVAYDSLAYYTRATFSQYVSSVFRIRWGGSFADVTLLEVTDLTPVAQRATMQAAGIECFSLLFEGGGGPSLGQNTFAIEHPALGSFQLLLVPAGNADNGANRYMAIINRLAYNPAVTPLPTEIPKRKKRGVNPTDKSITSPKATPPKNGPTNSEPGSSDTAKRKSGWVRLISPE